MVVLAPAIGDMIALLRNDFYARTIAGINAAGRLGLQGHMRDSETGLKHLSRGFQQRRPVIEAVKIDMGGKRYLSRRDIPDVH